MQATIAGTSHPVRDVLLAGDARALRYVVIDTGGWTESNWLLAAASSVSPSEDGTALDVDASDQDLRDAPVWSGAPKALGQMLAAMPPLVVGPFGATHAPLVMSAAQRAAENNDPDPRAEYILQSHLRGQELIGAPVFARDGELGKLADLVLDIEAGALTHLIIAEAGARNGACRIVPVTALRHRAEGDPGHLVLDIGKTDFAASPVVETGDPLARHMIAPHAGAYVAPV
ncbi:PRC-barrel domain-containing protein [Aestuariicoccus sp. MJ-SS9]|uniref:PRC-barrel domain-containing protein n=1 Tax=Aestuariicoccus sp. MJ-SS9 TaxID=3079855 RepID=UPI00290DE7C9|nr:PRC-barrel domain-containing protein [Aestuariicoccus sp. MJ-SS9]MDU8911977.1 PRC-barrel domain-containing protein [Aestuariicoccus sp. MJ-SS9]